MSEAPNKTPPEDPFHDPAQPAALIGGVAAALVGMRIAARYALRPAVVGGAAVIATPFLAKFIGAGLVVGGVALSAYELGVQLENIVPRSVRDWFNRLPPGPEC